MRHTYIHCVRVLSMYRLVIVWALLVSLAALSLYQAEEKADLKIGMLKTVDAIHPLIAKENGFFEQEGLKVSVHAFGTSPAMAEALAAGEIDAAYMSVVPAGIWKSKGTDIVILAGASRGGDMLCTRDGALSGKIAMSGRGTMTQVLYSLFVQDKFDFEPVAGIEPPDMPTALLVTKDVDAAFVWEPFATQIENSGGECIFDTGAEWKRVYGVKYQRNVLAVSGKVAKDPALIQKLLRINNRTVELLNQPGSEEMVSKAMKIQSFDRSRVEYNTSLNWESMVELWKAARKNGFMSRIPERSEMLYGG